MMTLQAYWVLILVLMEDTLREKKVRVEDPKTYKS